MTATPKVVPTPAVGAQGRRALDRMNPAFEWETERDEGTFVAHGYWCEIKRTGMGNLNGYVLIGRTHPYWMQEGIDLAVHGGITFEDGVKLGFDCAHAGDLVPGRVRYSYGFKDYREQQVPDVYRNWSFVTHQLTQLAAQLREIDTREIPKQDV